MRSKFFVFFTLTLMLILNACATFVIAEASGGQLPLTHSSRCKSLSTNVPIRQKGHITF